MDHLEDATRMPEDFDSRVRLLPLPELVVFPHAMQPLHIFEPRYCELLADALATDQLIAMATLTEGITAVSQLAAPIASTVCLGRIVSHTEVEGDKHNLLLVGIRRAQIIQELDTGRTFRTAEVTVEPDIYSPAGAEHRLELKRELLNAFAKVIPPSANVQKNLHELMAGQMGLGPITDIISYTLPFDMKAKLELLAQADVDARATELIKLLSSGQIQLHSVSIEEQGVDSLDVDGTDDGSSPGQADGFPPRFSMN